MPLLKNVTLWSYTDWLLNASYDSSDDEILNTSNTEDKQCQKEMTKDAVEYLIGWVAKKYRKKYPELGSMTYVLGNTCHDYTLPT